MSVTGNCADQRRRGLRLRPQSGPLTTICGNLTCVFAFYVLKEFRRRRDLQPWRLVGTVPKLNCTFKVRDVRRLDEVVSVEGHHRIAAITCVSISLLKSSDTILHDLKVRLLTRFRVEHLIRCLAGIGVRRIRAAMKVSIRLSITTTLPL